VRAPDGSTAVSREFSAGVDHSDVPVVGCTGRKSGLRSARDTIESCCWFERNGVCALYEHLHRARFELLLAATGSAPVLVDGALNSLPESLARSLIAEAHALTGET
jgi:hypothetical protein